MKNRIKLTESQLNRVIRESIKQTLSELLNKRFDMCGNFYEGFAMVELDYRYNFINANGELLSPNMWFDRCWDFKEGAAKIIVGDKCNFIKTNGELLSPNMWFDHCNNYFNEGFAAVEVDNKYNYINTNGEFLSPEQWFEYCFKFKNGFGEVQLDGNWYKIDTKGQLYTKNGEPVNSPLQENRRYRRNNKQATRITEA